MDYILGLLNLPFEKKLGYNPLNGKSNKRTKSDIFYINSDDIKSTRQKSTILINKMIKNKLIGPLDNTKMSKSFHKIKKRISLFPTIANKKLKNNTDVKNESSYIDINNKKLLQKTNEGKTKAFKRRIFNAKAKTEFENSAVNFSHRSKSHLKLPNEKSKNPFKLRKNYHYTSNYKDIYRPHFEALLQKKTNEKLNDKINISVKTKKAKRNMNYTINICLNNHDT